MGRTVLSLSLSPCPNLFPTHSNHTAALPQLPLQSNLHNFEWIVNKTLIDRFERVFKRGRSFYNSARIRTDWSVAVASALTEGSTKVQSELLRLIFIRELNSSSLPLTGLWLRVLYTYHGLGVQLFLCRFFFVPPVRLQSGVENDTMEVTEKIVSICLFNLFTFNLKLSIICAIHSLFPFPHQL